MLSIIIAVSALQSSWNEIRISLHGFVASYPPRLGHCFVYLTILKSWILKKNVRLRQQLQRLMPPFSSSGSWAPPSLTLVGGEDHCRTTAFDPSTKLLLLQHWIKCSRWFRNKCTARIGRHRRCRSNRGHTFVPCPTHRPVIKWWRGCNFATMDVLV